MKIEVISFLNEDHANEFFQKWDYISKPIVELHIVVFKDYLVYTIKYQLKW